jgi:hypothetical protein
MDWTTQDDPDELLRSRRVRDRLRDGQLIAAVAWFETLEAPDPLLVRDLVGALERVGEQGLARVVMWHASQAGDVIADDVEVPPPDADTCGRVADYWLAELGETETDDVDLLHRLVRDLVAAERVAEAVPWARRLHGLAPDAAPETVANCLCQAGLFDEARRYADEEHSAAMWLEIAEHLSATRAIEAGEAFARAIALEHDDSFALTMYAAFLGGQGRLREAEVIARFVDELDARARG